MSEPSEHEQVFIVRVPTFGDPETERERLLLRLARAVHHGVKPGCQVTAASHTLVDLGGDDYIEGYVARGWRDYDPKGDDQGHHGDEHPVALVPVDGSAP